LLAPSVRAVAIAVAVVAGGLLLVTPRAPAHEGHDHGPPPPTAASPPSPRVVATSEKYQFVGIVEGEVLVVYVDRSDDNAPVTGAVVEVSLDGETFKAELQEKTGTYEVTAPVLRKPGSYEVLVTLTEGGENDLLVGALTIPPPTAGTGDGGAGVRRLVTDAMAALPGGRAAVAFAGLLLLGVAAGGALLSGRRRLLILPAAILGVILASAVAWAHDGHDHGPDMSASSGNSPSRRPDGSLFVPKPTQRLLEIRTTVARSETRPKTVRFHGRVVPDPNRSGVVQPTLQGRYEAPEGGVPPLGTKVKAGDLLGRVAPAFNFIDASDMAQTLGNIDQEIALNRRKLARQEQLLEKNVVTGATVEDARILLEGLEKRRRELLAAKARPEDLRAPVDGVIAASRVVSGQVVGPSDKLFQVIDPKRLMVEALVFDQVDPDTVDAATASHGNGKGAIKLKFVGRSRALEQQYTLLQFQVVEPSVPLNAGAPVTVIATTRERITGILLPRSALAQAPSGQTVVFSHKEPEVFLPRPVRFEPFDAGHVLVTAGIAEGERIVVGNAFLLSQVR
jgi:RND family efflux transporter MFP subunit